MCQSALDGYCCGNEQGYCFVDLLQSLIVVNITDERGPHTVWLTAGKLLSVASIAKSDLS